jgi:succinoglycan biosynthesis protein ExoW
MISVIIPYYQKDAGILAKALASIRAQKACPYALDVIVVDDSSPAPVAPELARVGALPFHVQVIRQPNGGPGAARNAGLNRVAPGTRYIAFLDSDDEWLPDHLARAVTALDGCHDFYFADFYQLDQDLSAFARAKKIDTTQHRLLPTDKAGLHGYQGDMLDQIMTGNIIGTPTVVYDFERFKTQRFDTRFTTAGEDYLFWMALVNKGAKIAFSSCPEVRCGRGVNIYSGSNWGSHQFLLRVQNELNYRKETLKLYGLTSTQRTYLNKCMGQLRFSFSSDLFHRITHSKNIPIKFLLLHIKNDPLTYFLMPIFFMQIVLNKIKPATKNETKFGR